MSKMLKMTAREAPLMDAARIKKKVVYGIRFRGGDSAFGILGHFLSEGEVPFMG